MGGQELDYLHKTYTRTAAAVKRRSTLEWEQEDGAGGRRRRKEQEKGVGERDWRKEQEEETGGMNRRKEQDH